MFAPIMTGNYPTDFASAYLGHSANAGGKAEPLAVHLRCVAGRAAHFAKAFCAEDAAFITGIVHDLGKYASQFQRRLRDPRVTSKDHWSAGAAVCLRVYRQKGVPSAMVIQGHHTGLPDLPPSYEAYYRFFNELLRDHAEDLTDSNLARLVERWRADGFTWPKLRSTAALGTAGSLAEMLDIRLLFSALVDADFIETEAHFSGTTDEPRRYRLTGPEFDVSAAFQRVHQRVETLSTDKGTDSSIQQARNALWTAALETAKRPTGLFTMTAPTGAGKTLAMLGFALAHARRNGLRRVVLVMPFLNIIEQTAEQYRQLFTNTGFPDATVLEDHSLANIGADHAADEVDAVDESIRLRRLLAENWDSPIVLTSHVKCLESLMAHRPGRCRKLHRLAQSIILFDEVQTLPPKLAVPTLATLARLADPKGPFGSSVLFATATQPAFEHLDGRVRALSPTGWQPTEVVSKSAMVSMFQVAAQRVNVSWRENTPINLAALAKELARHPSRQVLCIVNLKRHAAELAIRLLDAGIENVQHLSTSLCPAHRRCVLDTVAEALHKKRPLRLIATQCVEAGVDLDFPTVYRALAPLEAIAQAAGRCNRHGGRPQRGEMVVINLDNGDGKATFPPGYGEAVGATRTFLSALRAEHGDLDALDILNHPDRLRRYYQTFYDLTGRTGSIRDDEHELHEAVTAGQFAKVAKLYRLIEGDTISVLVPDDPAAFAELVAEMEDDAPRTPESVRQWVRRARPLTVGLYRPRDESPAWSVLNPLWFSRRRQHEGGEADWWYLLPKGEYHPLLGLQLPEEMPWVI